MIVDICVIMTIFMGVVKINIYVKWLVCYENLLAHERCHVHHTTRFFRWLQKKELSTLSKLYSNQVPLYSFLYIQYVYTPLPSFYTTQFKVAFAELFFFSLHFYLLFRPEKTYIINRIIHYVIIPRGYPAQ